MTLSTIENDVDCKSTMALELAKIFNECQTTTMNHRRNYIALKQLQLRPLNQQSANFGGQTKGNRMPNKHARNLHELPTESELCEWEAQFFMEFFKIVGIVLAVKKTDDAVQRIIKFVHAFCIHSNTQSSNADSLAVERGIHARFLENFIQCLLHGVEAKDKMVRHRVCMLLNGCINAVDELRDDLLAIFVTKLAERLFDKEAVVRVAAVQALSRLQVNFCQILLARNLLLKDIGMALKLQYLPFTKLSCNMIPRSTCERRCLRYLRFLPNMLT